MKGNTNIQDTLRRLKRLQMQLSILREGDVEAGWWSVQRKIKLRRRRRRLMSAGVAAAVVAVVVVAAMSVWHMPGMPQQPQLALEESMVKSRVYLSLGNGDTPEAPVELEAGGYNILRDESGDIIYENIGGELHLHNNRGIEGFNTVETSEGSSYRLVMDDGTRITLGPSSKLVYPLNTTSYKVQLMGEALFDVAKQSKGRFTVMCGNGTEVTVLGTVFNIRAYKGESAVVTLERGRIQLLAHGETMELHPGEQAVVPVEGDILMNQVDAGIYTSWAEGIYEFDGVSLKEITTALELWYGVRIDFEKPEIGNRKFTGVILKSMSLKDTLDLLKSVSGIRFKVEGKTVIIY